jgi:hypothetical protein
VTYLLLAKLPTVAVSDTTELAADLSFTYLVTRYRKHYSISIHLLISQKKKHTSSENVVVLMLIVPKKREEILVLLLLVSDWYFRSAYWNDIANKQCHSCSVK